MKRPNTCFLTWIKCNLDQKKNNRQTFILFLAPLLMTSFAIISCYYHAYLMYADTTILERYLFSLTIRSELRQISYWMAVITRELTMMVSSLYSALACNIVIEIYVCVMALHQDLRSMCKKQHLVQSELQIWRQKLRCLEKVMRSVNDYLGGSLFVLLILSVSTLTLAIFQPIGEGMIELGLVLPICNMVVLMTGITVPSAILNGKVRILV